MTTKPLLHAAIVSCLTLSAFANGGGYRRGGVESTGTVQGFEPEGTENVRIRDEQLTIELTPTEARVQVRYIMKNMSGKRAAVRFGFPVEELSSQDLFESGEADGTSKKPKKGEQPKLEYCRDYQLSVAGKALASAFELESKQASSDPRFKGLKGWIVSKTSFDAGEEKTMEISYRADFGYDVVSVSEDGSVSAKVFKYRLSTGAAWNGPIEHGHVVVRGIGIDPSELTISKPVNRFRKLNDQWEWTFENLEPTLADDLVVQATAAERSYGSRLPSGGYGEVTQDQAVDFVERDGKWFARHSHYSIQASSTLPPEGEHHYDAKNVKGGSGDVWSEGAKGNGVGEWLELTLNVPKPLSAIHIFPGHSGDMLFKANARPKVIQVLLNGEHRFDAPLGDRDEFQRVPVSGYDKPVKTVRLTMKEVYPGTKYEDLCISSVQVETRLNKKPKVTPAR